MCKIGHPCRNLHSPFERRDFRTAPLARLAPRERRRILRHGSMCKIGHPCRNLHSPLARLAPRERRRIVRRPFLREVCQ